VTPDMVLGQAAPIAEPDESTETTLSPWATMFRHTYATNHLRAGFNIVDISRLLGHKDVATTQIYLHDLDNEDIGAKVRASDLGTMYRLSTFTPVEYKRIHIVSEEARRRMSEAGKRGGLVKVKKSVS
jgi:hypothetical protein